MTGNADGMPALSKASIRTGHVISMAGQKEVSMPEDPLAYLCVHAPGRRKKHAAVLLRVECLRFLSVKFASA